MDNQDDPRRYAPRRPRRLVLAAGALAVLGLCVAAGGLVMAHNERLARQRAEIGQQLQKGRRVLVVPARYAPARRTLEVPGSTAGFNQIRVYAKLPGYLQRINVDKGDHVKAGEVLAVLSSPETDRQVADAKARYWLQKVTDERNQKLVRLGVIAQEAADNSHAAMLQAKSAYLQIQAMQAYETIRAPFSGVVTARYVDPGALIPEATGGGAATPILELASLAPLRVYAQVPQSQALFIHAEDPAVIIVPELPGREFQGNVARIAKMLTPQTRTMLVEVDLPNRDRTLYPGMYAKLKFAITANPSTPLAPDAALIFKGGKTYLPIVRGDRVHLVEVKLGYDDGINVEILHGLKRDDLIAINMGQAVEDGEAVQPIFPENARTIAPSEQTDY